MDMTREGGRRAGAVLRRYLQKLQKEGAAALDYDRPTLLGMYRLLLFEKTWREQSFFIEHGHEDVIANNILQLAVEKIETERS